ncbi:ABC transporter ATP-binding protein [Austwickia chelonae]|uniref:ABC transporter ATP-binding protein n=1 Tax=Austwickia chelonae TaxID=100225 RepID=UPI000E2561E3|nr:ATP-binding cassette domain-containing protein [Austwickia chelonae]
MLEVQELTRRFGDHTAVDQVSFTVPDGQLIGFVGGNGAGKTTTMRMIMGLLQIHGGQVLWQGRPATVADRRTFGYMPEERGLYVKQGVASQLIYLGQLAGMSRPEARRSVTELLERFGLADRAKDKLESLSLGNQQRVQIAAAVMSRPQALILDEPFSGLDPTSVDVMADLLREHTREGVPVLFSSHQLDLVDRLSDGLVVLSKGRVVAQGTAEELRSAGPCRHRIVVSSDAGWVRDLSGVHVVDVDGTAALVELADETAKQALLAEALSRGSLSEFTPVRPSLSEIYREVTA